MPPSSLFSLFRDVVFARLVRLALPIIGLNVLTVLSLAVDTAMCGHLPDAEKVLTALGFAGQIVFLLMVFMMGLTVGTVVFVARAFGADNHERVNHILRQATQLTLVVGVGVCLLGNVFASPILELLGAEGDIVGRAVLYLRPLLFGTVFTYLYMLFAAVLRGVGNTRLAFLVALVMNGLNVALNYVLILGNFGAPSLGLFGAAVGTVCSQGIGALLLGYMIRREVVKNVTLLLRPAPVDKVLAWDLIRIGAPAALDMVILNAAFLSIVGMLGRLDDVAVAAHGIGLRVQSLGFVPGMSISQATSALVGQALGARDVEAAKRTVWRAAVLAFGVMTTLALLLLVFAPNIIALFDLDPEGHVGALAITWMQLLGYGFPVVGVYIAFAGLLQGAGATKTSLWINALSTLAVQIPLSYVLGFTFGLGPMGVWMGFPLSFVVKGALSLGAYAHGGWARVGERV